MNTNAAKILKIGLLSLFFLLVVTFAFLRSKDLIFGVKIRDVNITDGEKVADNVLHLTGNAKNATFVSLNGREISVDKKGDFNETIILFSGYNIINITAKDKFGDVDEKNYKVIY